MSVDTGVWSGHEFEVAINAETTVGTANTSTMQNLNVTGLSWMSQPLVQNLAPLAGESRVQDTSHIYTSDYGSEISVQVPIVLDTAVDTMLHENVMGATTASDIINLAYNYTADEIAHGEEGISDNLHTFTVLLVSPEGGECITLPGCVVTELSVSMDAGTESGRRHATVTFMTKYRPSNAGNDPGDRVAYGSTYRYLRQLTTKKQINSEDVVINKLEYTISNPLICAGMDSSGNPEVMTRAIPKATATGTIGVKYDEHTASLWEKRRAGTTVPIYFANNASFGSASFGLQCEQAVITGEVTPSAGDSGTFIDLAVEFAADSGNTKHALQVIP